MPAGGAYAMALLTRYAAGLFDDLAALLRGTSGSIQTVAVTLAVLGCLLCSLGWLLVSLLRCAAAAETGEAEETKTKRKSCLLHSHHTLGTSSYIRGLHSRGSLSRSMSRSLHRSFYKHASKPSIRHGASSLADQLCCLIKTEACKENRLLAKATPTRLSSPTQLDLSYQQLSRCPARVGYLGSQLVELNLSHNQLSALPEELGCLQGLTSLGLQANGLTHLPESLGSLSRLVELDVRCNKLKVLPPSVTRLSSLRCLKVESNYLVDLPADLRGLSQLRLLRASSNCLRRVPDSLCAILKLEELYLNANRLESLPERMGELVRLTVLDVSHCQLAFLPRSLSRCTSLQRLLLSHNCLEELPWRLGCLHQLQELRVDDNKLRYLPASLACLQLQQLTVDGNPLLTEATAAVFLAASAQTPAAHDRTLVELAAQAMVEARLAWYPDELPLDLQELLRSAQYCSRCERPYFTCIVQELSFSSVAARDKLPLYQRACRPAMGGGCRMSPVCR